MHRKGSFVIIQIEMDPVEIDLNLTLWQTIRYFFYYLFSFVYIFLRQYQVSECYLNTNEKQPVDTLKVLDHGIFLNHYDVLIPYENIMFMEYRNSYNILTCLAKLVDGKLEIGDSLLIIKIHNQNPQKLLRDVSDNMYYHLKYNKNKINYGVLNYSSTKALLRKQD
jgi:hypothetical protein